MSRRAGAAPLDGRVVAAAAALGGRSPHLVGRERAEGPGAFHPAAQRRRGRHHPPVEGRGAGPATCA